MTLDLGWEEPVARRDTKCEKCPELLNPMPAAIGLHGDVNTYPTQLMALLVICHVLVKFSYQAALPATCPASPIGRVER